MPQYKGRYSAEKCAILEKDVELLWKKVNVYELYGHSERNLRNKAVDELHKVKAKIQDGEGENVTKDQTKYGKQFGKNQMVQSR